MDAKWILCPLCGGKTRDKIREDTVLVNYPLYCPKCKQRRRADEPVSDLTDIGSFLFFRLTLGVCL